MKKLPLIFLLLIAALVFYCNYLIFLDVPNEKFMGAVQRIFYFHVASATASYCSFGVVLIASLYYLATKSNYADILAASAAEVGFVFCTIVLVSGMIWGHSAWNTWFRWEPRLVSFLLLWLIYFSYNLLRFFIDNDKIATHSAVLGIIGTIMVPIMIFSVKLLPQLQQLHPQVVENQGLHPKMQSVMFICLFTLVLFQFFLIWLRSKIMLLEKERYNGNS